MRDDIQASLALVSVAVLLATLLVAVAPAWLLEAMEAFL